MLQGTKRKAVDQMDNPDRPAPPAVVQVKSPFSPVAIRSPDLFALHTDLVSARVQRERSNDVANFGVPIEPSPLINGTLRAEHTLPDGATLTPTLVMMAIQTIQHAWRLYFIYRSRERLSLRCNLEDEATKWRFLASHVAVEIGIYKRWSSTTPRFSFAHVSAMCATKGAACAVYDEGLFWRALVQDSDGANDAIFNTPLTPRDDKSRHTVASILRRELVRISFQEQFLSQPKTAVEHIKDFGELMQEESKVCIVVILEHLNKMKVLCQKNLVSDNKSLITRRPINLKLLVHISRDIGVYEEYIKDGVVPWGTF